MNTQKSGSKGNSQSGPRSMSSASNAGANKVRGGVTPKGDTGCGTPAKLKSGSKGNC